MRPVWPFFAVGIGLTPIYASAEIADAAKAARSGTFDVAGNVRCAQQPDAPMEVCPAQVAHSGTAAAVVVLFPSGFSRMLMFDNGIFLRGNTTMSGTGKDTDWSISSGIFSVRVDDQFFEISEDLLK